MELLQESWRYALENSDRLGKALLTHLQLSGAALAIALLIALPLAIALARRPGAAQGVLAVVNGLRVVPSLAILFLALPLLGLGFRPALLALTLLALPPILINGYTALRGVEPAVIEAARGMGMSEGQVLRRVTLPLALPVMLTGVRTAAVEVIASAALAAYISAGGLGDFILRGFSVNRPAVMLVGAIPIALLALLSETILGLAQRRLRAHQG